MDARYLYKISNIGVLYEDDYFLILDKPAGLLSVPGPDKQSRNLTSILNAELEKKAVSYRLHPCHRLDKEASGSIIYAKGKSAQQKMMQLFKEKKIKKTYIAFLQGSLKQDQGKINSPIDGLNAATQYKITRSGGDFSVAEVSTLTGRKNQIRIHFKSIGHPLVGETRFAFRRDYKLRAKRTCLHAKILEFIHPLTKKLVRVDSPLPEDLKNFLKIHPAAMREG
jgi:23S rRNA pseudouridine1911/1915/1917 synthase